MSLELSINNFISQLSRYQSYEKIDCQEAGSSSLVDIFKTAMEEVYGKGRIMAACNRIGYDLTEMEAHNTPLFKNDIVKILLEVAQVKTSHVFDIFKSVKLIKHFESEVQSPLLKRLKIEYVDLFNRLSEAECIDDLDASTFHLLIEFLTPIKDLPLQLGCMTVDDEITTGPRTKGAAYCNQTECCGMLPGNAMAAAERQRLYQLVKQLPGSSYEERWEAYIELLSKTMAYKELRKGDIIPAPGSENGQILYYQVAGVSLAGKGMVAFVLKRATADMHELPPIILARGSVMHPAGLDSFSTYLTDMEPVIGNRAYEAGKELLYDILLNEDVVADVDRLIVAGHSLGGPLSEHFVRDFVSRRLKKESHESALQNVRHLDLYLFNSPGIGGNNAALFREQMDKIDDLQINGRLYWATGDLIHYAGGAHIGYQCNPEKVSFEVVLTEQKDMLGALVNAHIRRFFSYNRNLNTLIERVTDPDKIQEYLHNCSPCGVFIETVRLVFGCIFFALLIIPYLIIRCLCGWRGDSIGNEAEIGRLQEKFMEDLEYLSHLLESSKSESFNLDDAKQWIKNCLTTYLEQATSHLTDEQRAASIQSLRSELQSLSQEELLTTLIGDSEGILRNAKFSSDEYPLLVQVLNEALEVI